MLRNVSESMKDFKNRKRRRNYAGGPLDPTPILILLTLGNNDSDEEI